MAVARAFGWAAVSDRPMTWRDYALARQFLVEERIGAKVRQAQEIEKAQARDARRNIGRT